MPGLIAATALATVWEAYALLRKQQTLTRAIWDLQRHAPVRAGLWVTWAAVTWHLFVERTTGVGWATLPRLVRAIR